MLFRLRQRFQKEVVYVTDGGQWSFFWDAHYITEGLQRKHHVRARITTKPWNLHHQIIQFGDRYAYLHNENFRQIDESNHVFLTWFHGDLDDPNPDIHELFAALPAALPHIEKIVVPCQISGNVLRQVGVSDSQLVTIPLGVDLTQFTPPTPDQRQQVRAELGIPEKAFCIGSFQKDGRGWGDGMEPKLVKAPDIFLEVIAELAKYHNDLLVLLTGPSRGYIKRGLEKIGVPYIHRYLDNYPDIARLYQALNLYLITSRSEGGPKALMESWASGVPVVSTRMGMPADYIRHGENGMVADVNDVNALALATQQMIENMDLRERCIRQGLGDVQALGWSRVAERYYTLYHPYL